MAEFEGKKITVLRDNPPLPGKKYFLASMIAPDANQKHKVHAFKLHDVCEDEDTGRALCKYHHQNDPDFDVFLGQVGKWCPWVWNPLDVQNVEYADQMMTDLIREHRMNKKKTDEFWQKEVSQNMKEIEKGATKEGQMEMANRKEPAVSLWYKIQQLEWTIKKRREELEALTEKFHTEYTKAERTRAKKTKMPESEPAPMHFALLGSDIIEGAAEPTASLPSSSSSSDTATESRRGKKREL